MKEAEQLSGFFEAFALFNSGCNHCCTFSFECLPDAPTVKDAIAEKFEDNTVSVSVVQIDNWESVVRKVLEKWLFQLPPEYRTNSRKSSLNDDNVRQIAIESVMKRLGALAPTQVYRISLETNSHYECDWTDLAFAANPRFYFLHLGVSD